MNFERQAGEAELSRVRASRPPGERQAAAMIASALLSGGVLACLVFLTVASPALFGTGSTAWIQHAQWTGSSAFIARVVWALLGGRQRAQPSQPGRTSPDS